jgi:hypothetical protein
VGNGGLWGLRAGLVASYNRKGGGRGAAGSCGCKTESAGHAKGALGMMAARKNVTDRALRYRAVANMPDCERRCHFCGKPHTSNAQGKSIEVAHINGHEEDTEPSNLSWTCRSCNVEMANGLRKAGRGRATRQYNPPGGATSLAQYLTAIMSMKGLSSGMSVPAAVEMIHETSHAKRSQFANEIWEKRRARGNPFAVAALSQIPAVASLEGVAEKGYNRLLRTKSKKRNPRNPADGAAEMSEKFHGRPVLETVIVEESVHYHTHLAELGTLEKLVVKASNKDAGIVELEDFAGALLCSNEDGTHLYVRGGDQSVPLEEFSLEGNHDFEDLGEVLEIRYYTVKEHLGSQGGEADYYHEFGEDDKANGDKPRRPRLRYSTRDKLLSFTGGGYEVLAEGIAN